MDLQAIKTFIAVVEEGSFSKASERLLRTQPAVSLAVRRLEEELGERLLDRSSRQLVLTDAGEVVLTYGKRFESLQRDLSNALQELSSLSAGCLQIGANESSTLYLLPQLRRFRQLYPKIQIRVERCRSSRIPDKLLNGELELGVVSYRPGNRRIGSQVIYTDHLAFVVSLEHRLAQREAVSIKELGLETFIAHNVVSPYREAVLRRFQEHQVPLNMDIEMPTIESIRRWVQNNEGVAFLPRMCVYRELELGVLREVRVPELELERRIRLVYPQKRQLSRAAQAFLSLVKQPEGG